MEVAMASFVMAMGIATAIIALQTGFKFIDVARDTTLASQILQSEIERLRMMGWTAITALPEKENVPLRDMFTTDTSTSTSTSTTDASSYSTSPSTTLSADSASDASLERRFSVVRLVAKDPDRGDDMRLITLRVTWTSLDGRTHVRTFEAKYAKNGLYDYFYTVARPPSSS